MTWSLYALLTDEASPIDAAWLTSECTRVFVGHGCSIAETFQPFARWPALLLRWGPWSARLAYDAGDPVLADSRYIQRVAGDTAPTGVPADRIGRCDRRIRVVFGDDPERVYTDQMLWIIDFLRDIPGGVLFDTAREAWWV